MGFIFTSFLLDVITTIIVSIIFLYYFSVKTFGFWSNLGVRFAKPMPFFGNTFLMTFRKKSDPIVLQDIYNTYPEDRYTGMFIFRTPFLMLRDPQIIQSVLTKDFSHFYDRGVNVDEKLDLLSLHLVNLRGQQWKSLRSKLTPSFSSGKLKNMCSQLEECASVLSDYLASYIEQKDKSTDLREVMAKFATDVIGTCAFGMQFNTLKDPDSQFRKMGNEIFKPSFRSLLKFIARTFHPSLPYYLNLKVLRPDVEKFYLDFVKDAVRQREENQFERKDFIHFLIEVRKSDFSIKNDEQQTESSFLLTDQVLASNAFVFFLAGFETTSSTMSFLLLELAANPDIQIAVRKEIVEALDNHNGEVTYETVKDLTYLDMVISETLRMYPIGSVLVRECTQTYQVPDSSLVLKKDTKVLIPTFALHRDPKYFPDPEKFDPERFSSENKAKIIPGTYLPFGDGPRICIGLRFAMLEMKFAFCKILPKYQFTMSDKMKYPVVFKAGGPLLAPEDGIWLNIEKV